jgi:hypothetical protein
MSLFHPFSLVASDAVSVGYGVPEHSGKGFHPADSMQLQAH